MAFLTISGESWRCAGRRLGPRAGMISAAATLFALSKLLVEAGRVQGVLLLVSATLACAAVWLSATRYRHARQ